MTIDDNIKRLEVEVQYLHSQWDKATQARIMTEDELAKVIKREEALIGVIVSAKAEIERLHVVQEDALRRIAELMLLVAELRSK